MDKKDLKQYTDKQLRKEIKEIEGFLSEETSSTNKKDYVWLGYLQDEAEERKLWK